MHTSIAMRRFNVRLPDDVRTRLNALAASTGRPAAVYVREAVIERLSKLEYAYTLRTEADAVRHGELPTVTLNEVAAELGFDAGELRGEAQANIADE